MSQERLGISHSLPPDTVVVHSSVIGANCLGRITDLLSAWCKNELKFDTKTLSDSRMLYQGLLEFSCPKKGDSLGNVELAFSGGFLIVATRFPCSQVLTSDQISKELTQFWLNSEDAKLLKRMLSASDRVEVRYHSKLNLIEWRIIRAISEGNAVSEDQGTSFSVMNDLSPSIESAEVAFQELGDLPFGDWLSDVYKNVQAGNRAGNVKVASGESQDVQEWARVIVERETEEIEQDLKQIIRPETPSDDEALRKLISQNAPPSEEVIEARKALSDEEVEKILVENRVLKETTKELGARIKKLEFASDRERVIFQQKIIQMESLLKKKETVNQKNQLELRTLLQKQEEDHKLNDAARNDHFRNKATEMFEMLKQVKEENKVLEKLNHDLKRKEFSTGDGASAGGAMSQKYLDEQNKKMERTQRALDAEKAKVKSLSERMIVAEKEAQSAGPLIEDLESKVEHTLKVVQQHKKETEQVKLKLVQSEAEKNKIKNELMKAQADMKTMMKRQAS